MVVDRSLLDVAVRVTFTAQPAGTMTRPQPPVGFRTQPRKVGQGQVLRYPSGYKVAVHIHSGVFGRQSILHK